MKKTTLCTALLILFVSVSTYAQSTAKEELTNLLHEFLKGASENSAEVHDRFWAEDLIYTSSSGQRYGKEQIMAGFKREDADESENSSPAITYSAEDIRIQVYDDMAVVAFKLVGKTKSETEVQTDYYLNSGTFVKRSGRWKVINWQATKVPNQN